MKRMMQVMLVVIIVGCVNMTTRDQLGIGYTAVTAVRQVSTRLMNQDRLSSKQGAVTVAMADEARKLLDSGELLVKAGREDEAQSDLKLARSVLDQLEAYLRTKETK